MSVRAMDTIKKNFKEYTIESDGIGAMGLKSEFVKKV